MRASAIAMASTAMHGVATRKMRMSSQKADNNFGNVSTKTPPSKKERWTLGHPGARGTAITRIATTAIELPDAIRAERRRCARSKRRRRSEPVGRASATGSEPSVLRRYVVGVISRPG